jgi:hypothetical protein
MVKYRILLLFAMFNIVAAGKAQNNIEIKSYPNGSYKDEDSLVFFVTSRTDSVEKIWFSLDFFYTGRWREESSDIFANDTDEQYAHTYFLLKKSKIGRFCFYLKNLDSSQKKLYNVKMRIVLNTYPSWFKSSKQMKFNSFTIRK